MSDHSLYCASDRRRHQVRARGRNGIDYIEVGENRKSLVVYFIEKAPRDLQPANIRISGGRRVRDLRAEGLSLCIQDDEERDDCLTITLNKQGDFSTYRLCLVALDEAGKQTDQPVAGFDPRYACLDFSFQASCPSDLDCADAPGCPPAVRNEPEINYLAKDYASFRQLILDRLALLLPDWQERHIPDIGLTLVELLAYAGDHLSYYQDAVGTEAYLDTARQRISVRRHTRLVDYLLHEGCNARTWVCLEVDAPFIELNPEDAYFITGSDQQDALGGAVLDEVELRSKAIGEVEVFEALACQPIWLYAAHNVLNFYTWGDSECCLPKGATSATLRYDWQPVAAEPSEGPTQQGPTAKAMRARSSQPVTSPTEEGPRLRPGDVLIFEEVKGPKTGSPYDADPQHRHAVRLTRVTPLVDDLYEPPVQLVEIEWGWEDALPFAFCLSAIIPPTCEVVADISVARGNAILVDHGHSIEEELPTLPAPDWRSPGCDGEGRPSDPVAQPVRYRPTLAHTPLTHRAALAAGQAGDPAHLTSARAWLRQAPHEALPVVCLSEQPITTGVMTPHALQRAGCLCADEQTEVVCWQPRLDLLASGPEDRHFVAEIDNEGVAHLRFGDGELGHALPLGMSLRAHYRLGNGAAGNVGAEAIAHLVYRREQVAGVTGVRNPLPAVGGVDAEPVTEAKLFAPQTFRKRIERAITADDYARLAERTPLVQRAAASLRWMGSWYEMRVAVDALSSAAEPEALFAAVAADLYPYRRIGHDLAVVPAEMVPLALELAVCVKPNYLRGHVRAALLDLFSNRVLRNGQRGFFHPDNLNFGDTLYVSKLVALAQGVAGVESVQVKTLQPLDLISTSEAHQILDEGLLEFGPTQIAQLDNDPSQPENGRLILHLDGGRG
jgi:hypothetical protein